MCHVIASMTGWPVVWYTHTQLDNNFSVSALSA